MKSTGIRSRHAAATEAARLSLELGFVLQLRFVLKAIITG